MDKIRTVGIILLFLTGSVLAESKLILNREDGAAETCEVLSCINGMVKLSTRSGVISQSLISFTKPVQKKIRAWAEDEAFLGSGLSVKIEEAQSPGQDGVKSEVWHCITLKNRSDINFEGLILEGVTFFKTENEKADMEFVRFLLTTQTVSIVAGAECFFKTETMALRDLYNVEQTRSEHINTGEEIISTYKYFSEDDLLGFYLRLSKMSWKGDIISIDFDNGKIPKKREWRNSFECTPDKGLTPPEGLLNEDMVDLYESGLERETTREMPWAWLHAYKLCRYYSVMHNVEKTEEWAEQARSLFSGDSSPSKREGYSLSDLDLFVINAKEDPFPAFFQR